MKCPRCRFETPSDAEFCPECGAKLVLACAQCGTANAPGHKFCKKCGQPLASAAQTPIGTRFAAPEAYTPKHLAEKILTSKSALEGERKQVTVLFADMKGSMELLSDRDPEEARKLLDPVLERMMEAVHRYEGTVNQVMGDGIMALFGAPLAHEDHAVRACYAALRMLESVGQYAEAVHRTEGVPIQVRVGLNSGEVVVRSIGSDLRVDYSAVGHTTHLAARMEQMARPDSILITADVLRLAEGFVAVKPLGARRIKGMSEPIEVCELIGASAVRSRLQASAARGLTKFVGRTEEIAQLVQALGLARGGHGQVVAVVGEPGVGKSRLYWEFTHSHHTRDWLILEASSVSYGKATPYLPITDLLRAYFQIEGRDDARKIREKVTGKLLSLDRALEPSLPAFFWLLDAPDDDAEWERLDPAQRRQRTLEAVKRVLLRESQIQPLAVLFEDLHWIDAETQALLDSLVESLPTARLLLLVNYRPEYRHGWGGKTYYRQLRIDPLPPESAEELLAALLGGAPELEPLKRLLVERTEGNPFFLEESVRTLVETKVLVGERGAYRLAKAAETVQIPATAQAILAARIDRLPAEDKRLLQAASVVGKDVPFALLESIADEGEEGLRAGTGRLQAAEFLYEVRLFPDLEYTFKHALTHEVAYGSLLQERRRALHARMVEAIEARYRDRLAEQADRLAHHAFRGELWEQATHYARQVGDRAAALCADAEAVAAYTRALEALSRLPATAETARLGIDLRLALRAPLWRQGQLERLREIFREAEALATRFQQTDSLDAVYAFLVQYHWAKGEYDQAIGYGQRCLETDEQRHNLGLCVAGHYYMGASYQAQGAYRRAIECYQAIIDRLEGPKAGEQFGLSGLPYSGACALAAECASELGDLARALELVRRGEPVANAADHLYSKVVLAIARGRVLLRQNPAAVAAPLEGIVAACREKKFAGQAMRALTVLGQAYGLVGRPAQGIPLVEEAIGLQEKAGAFVDRALWTRVLAGLHLGAGNLDRAQATAETALGFARRHGERGNEAWTHRVLGQVMTERGERGEALRHFEMAQGLADQLGMRPLVAHCHLGVGKLYRRTGDRPNAQEHLTTAATMYHEMDMRFWLEQAEAELKLLG
ncbi:MAG: AAA family ATPase [Candidatus Rokubacteria bacterium]|nr:AAA family ATPase [Candidatus Rokubacteria bacterium]